MTPPKELVAHLKVHCQSHLLAGWADLTPAERESLVGQIRALDLSLLAKLYAQRDAMHDLPADHRIEPLPHILPDAPDAEAKALGAAAISRGEVAALVVAGGQGSRLGFEHPKGLFPIGPVSDKSLFQLHAEKLLARSRRHGRAIPFLVMTSDVTHAETTEFFRNYSYFGLPEDEVFFFQQGTMPALDLATGRVLLDGSGRLFAGPDGHGGTLTALARTGLLAELADRGVKHIFYFQVDNPLVKIADPQFIGQHVRARADVSSKVIPKDSPTDKLGNFVLIDGKLSMIEYSDLPMDLATAVEPNGELRIRAGSPAIHVFDVSFLKHATASSAGLPVHFAKKKVAYWDHEQARVVQPEHENALKFERFIFDVLPLAERSVEVFTSRREEFAPLKNATGADSPESVRRAMSDLAIDWLRRARATVAPGATVELSPFTALEPEDLIGKISPGTGIRGLI